MTSAKLPRTPLMTVAGADRARLAPVPAAEAAWLGLTQEAAWPGLTQEAAPPVRAAENAGLMPGAGLTGDVPAAKPASGDSFEEATLYLIGHAHIDPVWLWQWQEGFQEIKQTWRSALDRMREYPEFRFSASSAAFYEWIEQNEPQMFAEIRERVAEGRWETAGGWWVEPDCNIPSGESFARHGLYGQRYFLSRFGRATNVGFNPDAFGHASGLPQILARARLGNYAFLRPQPHEKLLPRIFWWESDDGSRVLCFRIIHEYGSWTPELENWIRRSLPELGGSAADELMVFYGVGNHGGGPTRANLESLRRLDDLADLPRLERSTMDRFFTAIRSSGREFPVVRGELQMHAPGCYAAHSGVKRWNRQAEALLAVAERWSCIGELAADRAYPLDDLTQAWKAVLFNQFHDTLAGTAIEPAYDDVRDLYGEAMGLAGRALNHATQALARRIDTSTLDPSSRPVVCFNPHAWPARLDIELEFGGLAPSTSLVPTESLVDDEGRPQAVQLVRSRATVRGGRQRVSFIAELPPLGYRVYRLVADPAAELFPSVEATDSTLDNGRLRLEIDATTGWIQRLLDRRTGAELLAGRGAVPTVIADSYDTWGHGLVRLDQVAGRFEGAQVRLVEHGPVKSVIHVESHFRGSRLLQEIQLSNAFDRVDVRCTLDWAERWHALKLRFDLAVREPVATFETAYAHLRRPTDGMEVPGQRWVDLSGQVTDGTGAGLTLLNDGKYGFDVLGSSLGMTAVRSPIYAHHEPYLPRRGDPHTWQDQGTQHFSYSLLPHGGDWRSAGAPRAAAELNERPITLAETLHDGDLPMHAAFVGVEPDNVVLTALKRWEDGAGLVARLFETAGLATQARLDVPLLRRSETIALGPGELRTVLLPLDAASPARELDLLELDPSAPAARASMGPRPPALSDASPTA